MSAGTPEIWARVPIIHAFGDGTAEDGPVSIERHMGLFEVKGQVYGFMGSAAAVGSDPSLSPFP